MIYPEEISFKIPSTHKIENMRITVFVDLQDKSIFLSIPGRHLRGINWVEDFKRLEKGNEALEVLLDDRRRFRWCENLQEKIFEGLADSGDADLRPIDTVNWVTMRIPNQWDPTYALIEARKIFSIGCFSLDLFEGQYLKLLRRLESFLSQRYEKIHSPNYQSEFPAKVADSVKVYERLMFFILSLDDYPSPEMTDAVNKLRKLFQVEQCPFVDHPYGTKLHYWYLSDTTPFCEIFRKVAHEVNSFPLTLPTDDVSLLFILFFWDLRTVIQNGVVMPEPFDDGILSHIKAVENSNHDTFERCEEGAGFVDFDDFDYRENLVP